jgi:hypothetical protein
MGYELHIERRAPDGSRLAIAVSEWRAAVERTNGARIAEGDHQTTNPRTGEVIVLRNTGGDAEVYFPADAAWRRVFRWSRSGRVSFKATPDFEESASDLRRVAIDLAGRLGALLVGDEGEIYE